MWDQRYSEPGFAYGTEPNDFLKAEYQRIPKGGRVLCLAEGEGRNAVFLAKAGYQVTAVDQSEVGLNKARQLATVNGTRIQTQVADLANFDFGVDTWDGIVSIMAHTPEAVRRQIHTQVSQALRPNGIFLLEAYTLEHTQMEGVGGPPPAQADMFMSLELLTTELAGLDIELGQEVRRVFSEGKYHYGLSAVVQFIGRKESE